MTSPAHPETPGVLLVDDEASILKSLARLFRKDPMVIHVAGSAREALEILEHANVQVIVSDQQMPEGTGVELLAEVRRRWPDTVRILLTGYAQMGVAVAAINHGEIFRLVTKPWNDEELRATVMQALESYALRRELARLDAVTRRQNKELSEMNRTLELKVAERTSQLEDKHGELRLAYVSTVRALAEAIDAKDPYTRGHSERVGVYASRVARELGCRPPFVERIYLAGLLHDVGKIGIPDAIIAKPGRLTPEEYEEIKRHPEIGARILEPVSFLADVVACVRHHHEWFDGSDHGYPERLSGTQIPFPSRIILVADTVEAMTSDRPYRRGLRLDAVIEELHRFSGSQFDPVVVDACISMLEREREGFLERSHKFDILEFLANPEEPR